MAFFHGCEACAAGKKLADNPHPADTPAARHWLRGWQHEFNRLPEILRAQRQARGDNHAAG
jgi:hypothetical protein